MTRARGGAVAAAACLASLLPARALALDAERQQERLLFESQRLEQQLAQTGQQYDDPGLTDYLQRVLDDLFPDQRGRLRVHVVRDVETNAFALPSGALYVHTGAFLRLRNEAELAALLGHEGAHVIEAHSLERAQHDRTVATSLAIVGNGTMFAGSFGLAAFGGLLAETARLSSMAGYSRGGERDADAIGRARATAAGYEAGAAAEFFDRFHREVRFRGVRQSFYPFATHPRYADRANDARPVAGAAGRTDRDQYLAHTGRVRRAVVEDLRSTRSAETLIFLLGEEGMAAENAPIGEYMLGEAYRLRGTTGDAERAREHYQRSVEGFPDYAPAWAALGRDLALRGDREAAIRHLERYLELAPTAPDAAFVRQNIERLR